MYQAIGMAAIIYLAILLIFGGGLLFGITQKVDKSERAFGLGFGLVVSSALGLLILAGIASDFI